MHELCAACLTISCTKPAPIARIVHPQPNARTQNLPKKVRSRLRGGDLRFKVRGLFFKRNDETNITGIRNSVLVF